MESKNTESLNFIVKVSNAVVKFLSYIIYIYIINPNNRILEEIAREEAIRNNTHGYYAKQEKKETKIAEQVARNKRETFETNIKIYEYLLVDLVLVQ